MPEQVLHAERRTERGGKAVRRLRRAGGLPAILYGHKEEAVALTVPGSDFEALVRAGTRMRDLTVGGQTQTVLIKDVQFDPLGDRILHVDFVRVALDEAVEVTVPLEVHGTAAGVKEGGVLDQLLREVTVSCLPRDIPETIRVRVDDLGIGQTRHLSEVAFSPGVRIVGDGAAAVVTVHPPAVEVEAAPALEEAPAAPEVMGREPGEGEGERQAKT